MQPDAADNTRETSLKRYAWLSIAAAVATIGLKGGAWLLTDSVGLLSDAAESLVNLVAAIVALYALSVAEKPADDEHAYGHTKVEYFSSGFEGALILVAALAIGVAAFQRLLDPHPVRELTAGATIALVASAINLFVARVLLRAARRHGSIALEADAKHLMTDVWTSIGVVIGLAGAALTGWDILDPLLALAVTGNILYIGISLLRRSAMGLLDTSLSSEMRTRILDVLDEYETHGVHYHALRTRRAGARRFISFHVLVPGEWTVQQGHDLLEVIEERIRNAVPNSTVFTHLEPIEDPVSFQDTRLERR
ncbi:MAG: cation diffusion facilitator family transporter [Longimicrobiales bacterium]